MGAKWDALTTIRNDEKLMDILRSSPEVLAQYKPRSARKTQSGLAFKRFWESQNGIRFCLDLEKRTGWSLSNSQLCGAVKLAVIQLVVEIRKAKGLTI